MPDSALTYVELLRDPTGGSIANWDPESDLIVEMTVRVGDYGLMTQGGSWVFFWLKKGMRFVKHGNIYKDGKATEYGIPDPVENGGDSEGEAWVTSENATRVDMSLFGRERTRFSSGQGAILAMKDTMITSIEAPGALKRVLEDPSMRGFSIVSEVQSSAGGAIALGLPVEVSGPASVGATAKWVKNVTSGNFKSQSDKFGKRTFYPLYKLASLSEEGMLT
ncbi:hypothetical protein MVEN_02278200 [Mycena venus]|uniref:Uncharacterized protein n=1 Tax=Mycena venus TaxID=2733690 RepID=A0A8H6X4U0_9AGAR|nr:hypothetical protein MVEN_02278200 [Mycena venus]